MKFWKTADQLPGLVALSLSKAIEMFPAIGWVRADRPAGEELLGEINNLRKKDLQLRDELHALRLQNDELQNLVNGGLKPVISDIAGLDESITLQGAYKETY